MLSINNSLVPADLLPAIDEMWTESSRCLHLMNSAWKPADGSPVFTVAGRYTSQGWTEWTQGFQVGSALLQFDATQEEEFLQLGLEQTRTLMAPHVSHTGVHDHGFNNVSTYGALRRLMMEGRIRLERSALDFYELALKVSGAVQASRWATTAEGGGYIYSFNGPQSLFCDTMRSLRSLAIAHALGHRLMGENDVAISLLERLIEHAATTARYNVYYGEGRDQYDVRGRVAHESLFNPNDGRYRCPSTQQGYSPFTTWTRGLAWIMLGYAELLEFMETVTDAQLLPWGGRKAVEQTLLRPALAACDFYIENTPTDGIPYWDTGAPGLAGLGNYLSRPAEPFNDHEPVDSSAAAIGCQGLLRLGRYLRLRADSQGSGRYWQAGLTVLERLLSETYTSRQADHQGLLLHSVYHRPRGWDYVPAGRKIPCGESCLWGDYHLREAALYVQRIARDEPYYSFMSPQCET